MKVLWIAPNGGNYKHNVINRNGGWIGALQEKLMSSGLDLELGIVFLSSEDNEPSCEGRVTYMPIRYPIKCILRNRLFRNITANTAKEDTEIANLIRDRVNAFKPDIVHVWGTENNYSAVIPFLDTPFLVHIQGFASLYSNSYLPPGFSTADLKATSPWWNPANWLRRLLKSDAYSHYKAFLHQAERELAAAASVKNWAGRTEWDRAASQALSPGSRYFICEEVMRSDFEGSLWKYHYRDKLIIQSNISPTWYKGTDVVLKTAAALKGRGVIAEWHIFGISRQNRIVKYISTKLNITPEDVGVYFHGQVDGQAIREGLLACDVYVHPSYIENSSNAIAEAMMLGVPVIAQYVGGNPSMLKHDSGVLVAPNEPYMLATAIIGMRDKKSAEELSLKARNVANNRQNADKTVANLMDIYHTILNR